MSRYFISADIEGTCGIADWEETEHGGFGYDRFSAQMSREVGACCEGILRADPAHQVLIRDAHDTARNLQAELLPQEGDIRLFRGWGRDPYAMMSGLDSGFSGAMFTGYHSAVGWPGNPLSHTMNGRNFDIRLNGETMPELMMNSLTAAMFGVPVLLVTGDEQLCRWFLDKVPAAQAVPVSSGVGKGSISLMPGEACRRIREAAERAVQAGRECLYPRPETYSLEVTYGKHFDARSASWYPGTEQLNDRTVRYESRSWMDVLTFMHFCL